MKPIFLLSLPRSGSTYLQRMIGGNPQVATAGEPYLALGQYSLLDESLYSRFGSRTIRSGQRSVLGNLPGARDTLLREMGKFCEAVYAQMAETGENYFLDKSPRNSIIGPDLLTMFPDARFVILWRNPLAVLASTYRTWKTGMRSLELMRVDWELSFPSLAALARSGDQRVCTCSYEEIITDKPALLQKVGDFLGLELSETEILSAKDMKGYLGDPEIREKDGDPVKKDDKWTEVIRNPVRKSYARRVLRNLEEGDLRQGGFDQQELLRQLDRVPMRPSGMLWDIVTLAAGKLARRLHLYVFLNERRLMKERGTSLTVY